MDSEEARNVKDANGNKLNDGDSVSLIKDLKVKSSSSVLNRGTVFKDIRLTNNDQEIDCTGKHRGLVLRAEFVKKA